MKILILILSFISLNSFAEESSEIPNLAMQPLAGACSEKLLIEEINQFKFNKVLKSHFLKDDKNIEMKNQAQNSQQLSESRERIYSSSLNVSGVFSIQQPDGRVGAHFVVVVDVKASDVSAPVQESFYIEKVKNSNQAYFCKVKSQIK